MTTPNNNQTSMLLIIVYEERKDSRRVYSAYKTDIIENQGRGED
jgi:hypothetical protein